jgi:hypothetical protein
VEINRIISHSSRGVILAEYVIRRLLIIHVHLGGMLFSLFRELVRCCSIAAFVGLVCLSRWLASYLTMRLSREGGRGELTLSKQLDRFAASCRARSRSRSYSASASPL